MQATRASRISEVEWNARRPKLEKLYLDDNVSRQEIIEIMAREDNFFTTEKQLKYQFNKWGLKKYIKDRDLMAMSSVKRKRQELGKNTGFMYRGHLLEQERLERALKRRKGPLISSPDLPPYIRALVSPRQSSSGQTSAFLGSIEGASHASGRSSSLGLLSSSPVQPFEASVLGDAVNSLGGFSDPLSFQDGEQAQANGGSWEGFLDNAMTLFSPGRWSLLQTPYGQDIQGTGMENISQSTPQIASIPANVPAPQSPHHNDFPTFDLNQDIDFSIYLNSPERPSTASSSSRLEPNPRRSVERRSLSAFQLTNHDDTQRENREFDIVSKSTVAVDQALDPVTGKDLEAESIVSLLLLLRSLVFPPLDTASQRYEHEKSMLSDLFCAHRCELLCHEMEELLEFYLEESLGSIRKRRTARVPNLFPSVCNPNPDKRRQGFECSDGPQRLSNPIKSTNATKMRTTFFRYSFTPRGYIVFQVREGTSSPIGDEGIDPEHLITISFMPRAMERTLGICVGSSRTMGGPAISPQIKTFNVVPDDSAIIQCVRKNDLGGIQALFDLGAASARDVDSHGISLLHYAMYTGCSDVFRLLVQGGASTNECDDCRNRKTDVITVVWQSFVLAFSDGIDSRALSMEKVKIFEECVAITQLALDNNCTIDSADHRRIGAGPLFSLVGSDMADIDASVLVDAIAYLISIGWDLEEKNSHGQTPLLYAAAVCGPQVARCLRVLVERGARLNARDEMGRGPLLSAFNPPWQISNWMDMTCIAIPEEDKSDNNWDLSEWFRTEDRRNARDYYDTESKPDHLEPHAPSHTSSLDGNESSQLPCDQGSSLSAEQPAHMDLAISDLDSNASSCSEESVSNPEDDDYVYCLNDDGDFVWIQNPIHVIKDRIRIKLKILLEAGCDPNDQDNHGKSTNDYARLGLWPQWLWALEKTGYVFDEEQNRWVKRIDSV